MTTFTAKTSPVDSQRIAALLRNNRLFEVLADDEMAALVALGHLELHSQDSIIFNKGDPGDRLYAIVKGQVAIWTASESGKMITLNI